jgi:hypothetical protein
MSHPRSRTLALVLAGLVLLAPVAGCGSSTKHPAASTTDPATFIKRLSAAMTKEGTAHLELQLGSSVQASADVDYATSGTEMALNMVTGNQTVRVVIASGAMYLQQTKGDKYLKIDKSDPALGSLLDQVSSIGPQATLNGLKPGIKKIADRGTVTLDGAQLTHYVLTVDTAKVKSNFGALTANVKLPKTVSYDVYVDSAFLLRELRITISDQKLVMKASDWGKPVTITVPPASQVMTR